MSAAAVHTPVDFPVLWRCPEDADRVWVHDVLHYPNPVTPLEFSFIEGGIDAGMTKAARAYDVPLTVHDRHINTYLYTSIESHDLPPDRLAALGERSTAGLRAAMGALLASWDTSWLPEIQRHLAWWSGLDHRAASLSELREHLGEAVRRWQRLWEIHFLLFIPSMLAVSEFADFHADLFEDATPFAPYELLTGFPTKTVESGQQLWALSRRILAWPEVHEAFRTLPAAEVVPTLEHSATADTFLAQLEEYLSVHGERADKISLHDPYWVEDPIPVIKNLQNYIREEHRDLAREMQHAARLREERVSEVRSRLSGYPKPVREEFDFLLRAAQQGAFLKEEHGYWIDYKASYAMRRLLLAIGRRLESAGALPDADDLFYLHLEEVDALLAGGDAVRPAGGHRVVIGRRRSEAERFAQVAAPPMLGAVLAEPTKAGHDRITEIFRKVEGEIRAPAASGRQIVGNPGSPGIVTGTVRVIHDLRESTKLQPGDILVAETTAPPWTPLFASVGAVVTDSGGILSHSAVVAREYGIPAVVGAAGASRQLGDGQRVEVDGDRGIVRILD